MLKLKPIKIATHGVAHDFQASLFPAILRSLGYEPIWTANQDCNLYIIGPFAKDKIVLNWIPKPLRPLAKKLKANNKSNKDQNYSGQPRLFITGENVRPDFYPCDYAISFDLGITGANHFRMPYWMEMVDWSEEGVTGNLNPRYGRLLSLERLMQPLGNEFLSRPQKAAIFASHLREPRKTLLEVVKKSMPVQEYGRSFNPNVKNHLESGFVKYDELKKVAFNLCPENGMHPGYYTEKIPEAFMAGCLPITWVDENVKADFNPEAFINLAPMTHNHFSELQEILHSKSKLNAYTEQALLTKRPTLDPLKEFVDGIIRQALT